MNECGEVRATKQVLASFIVGKFKNEVICDVVPMNATHLLLGRPWQFNRKTKHDGFRNRYTVEKYEKIYTLAPLSPRQVYVDQLKFKKVEEAEQEFIKNNGEDVWGRLKIRWAMSVKQLRREFQPLEIGLKILAKKENIWKAKSGEKKIMMRKVCRKIRETP